MGSWRLGTLAFSFAKPGDIVISDTHSHFAFRIGPAICMQCDLSDSGVSLISWALVSDGPFLQRQPSGEILVNFKPTVDQLREAYQRMLGGMRRRIRGENLYLVSSAEDVDLALKR